MKHLRFTSRHFRVLSLSAALLFALSATAFASPRSDAWKLRRSDPQAALSQLQAVAQSDPNDAKTQYFMALILKDLNRPQEALQALSQAKRIDPSLGFTENPAGVAKLEQSLSAKATSPDMSTQGRAPARNDSASSGVSQSQEISRALTQTGVYVAPSMLSKADPSQIAQAIQGSSLKTNVVVLDGLPPNARSVSALAQAVHNFMSLGDNGLMIAVAGRSVGVYGGGLDKTTLNEIAKSAAKTFDSEGYAQGVAQIARMADEEKARGAAGTRNLGLLLVGVPVGGFLLYKRHANKLREEEAAQARVQARDLSNKLAPQFEKLDSDYEYALLAETDPNRKAALQEQRARAGEAFSASMKRLGAAQNGSDFIATVAALQAAQMQMQRARNVLENKPENDGVQAPSGDGAPHMSTHARGNITQTPPDVIEVPPLGADLPGARQGYALDFFTSQPVLRNEMVPVDLEVNGQKRRVWASRQSAQNALAGQPQIATVNNGGQQRAWFDVPQYNPWQNFGSTMLQMMTMNMLLNSMMGHSYAFGGGYGGYGGYSGGWFDSGYQGGYNEGYNDGLHHGGGYGGGSDGYDNRTQDVANQAGEASFDSPFAGGGGWGGSSDDAGSSSMDVFGGGSSYGGDSS